MTGLVDEIQHCSEPDINDWVRRELMDFSLKNIIIMKEFVQWRTKRPV